MKNITYILEVKDKETIIKGHWLAPCVDFMCEMKFGGNDNADEKFRLFLMGGQVCKGELEMYGPLERAAFIEMLEVILREIKRTN